jgi:pyrroline-5-carboxylate reductase
MKDTTIAFIGAGNMANCLIGGLIKKGHPANQIWASNRSAEKLNKLKNQGIHVTLDNNEAAKHADVIILAVKPQLIKDVCVSLSKVIQERAPLVISVAAGIRNTTLSTWLGNDIAIVRAMPNTPALLGLGVTGLCANAQTTAEQQRLTENITNSVGTSVWLDDESHMDALTAVSGCGPAYFFLVMEAMIEAAVALGLSPEAAKALTLQTALGAAHMATQPEADPLTLRQQVTSPGGVTEQAIINFEQNGIRDLFKQALNAAVARSQAMAESLAKS